MMLKETKDQKLLLWPPPLPTTSQPPLPLQTQIHYSVKFPFSLFNSDETQKGRQLEGKKKKQLLPYQIPQSFSLYLPLVEPKIDIDIDMMMFFDKITKSKSILYCCYFLHYKNKGKRKKEGERRGVKLQWWWTGNGWNLWRKRKKTTTTKK